MKPHAIIIINEFCLNNYFKQKLKEKNEREI